MAKRPIYIPLAAGSHLVKTTMVDFQWYPGFSPSQKKKSVQDLHQTAIKKELCHHPLEVSSKSELALGVQLSAFNLKFQTENEKVLTVETAFQASKVFAQGGPYVDLLEGTSREAKKDPRLKTSGELVRFVFLGQEEWALEPKTAFYDWVYMKALQQNESLIEQLAEFDAFTDIEFNPEKSINCQAYSVALYCALEKRGILREALESKTAYLEVLASFGFKRSKKVTPDAQSATPPTPSSSTETQPTLF